MVERKLNAAGEVVGSSGDKNYNFSFDKSFG